MKKLILSIVTGLVFATGAAQAADVYTEWKKIGTISTNAETLGVNVGTASGGWGATGCQGAKWAYAPPSSSDTKLILATALAAQANGKQVRFYGSCQSSGSNYFVLRYMDVK